MQQRTPCRRKFFEVPIPQIQLIKVSGFLEERRLLKNRFLGFWLKIFLDVSSFNWCKIFLLIVSENFAKFHCKDSRPLIQKFLYQCHLIGNFWKTDYYLLLHKKFLEERLLSFFPQKFLEERSTIFYFIRNFWKTDYYLLLLREL